VSWTVIIPVKRLSAAKTRLRGAKGTGQSAGVKQHDDATDGARRGTDHELLVLAMALDTMAATLASPVVGRVVVVTADPAVAEEAALLGAEIISDVPDAGLNPALAYAAAQVRRTGAGTDPGVAALTADVPALRTSELTEALRAADLVGSGRDGRSGTGVRAFVADAAGTGTVLLAAPAAAVLEPCFGPGSAAAHAASGAVALAGDWPSLRRDVDTPDDLAQALELGLGLRAAAALSTNSRQPESAVATAD
jgi:2-phospho-L-lactate guanylyltransferase